MTLRAPVRRAMLGISALLAIGLAGCGETSPLLQGGIGTTESEPFRLQGGPYALGWTASPQTVAGCDLRIELRRAGGDAPIAEIYETFDSAGARGSAEEVGELSSGEYQLVVTSTCESWTAVVGEQPATAA